MMMRKSNWSFDFLDKWDALYETFKNKWNHDQFAFETLLKSQTIEKDHVLILPPEHFMTYDTHHCIPPKFGIHFPAGNKVNRVLKYIRTHKIISNQAYVRFENVYFQLPTYLNMKNKIPSINENNSEKRHQIRNNRNIFINCVDKYTNKEAAEYNDMILVECEKTLTQNFGLRLFEHIKFLKNLKITIAIPAIRSDLDNLKKLQKNIEEQTMLPNEVVVVISGITKQECPDMGYWVVICVSESLKAGAARNLAWEHSHSNIISFFDADDHMYTERIEVIYNTFLHHPNAQMVLHEWDSNMKHNINLNPVLDDGHFIYSSMLKTEGKRLDLRTDMTHGHVSIKRNIGCSKFTSKWAEDSIFVRSCVKYLGKNADKAFFIRHPLTRYIPRTIQTIKSTNNKKKHFMTDAMHNTFEVSPKFDIQNTKKIHERLLYMLTHFVRIAEKYNLDYWACAGTLLGAIRHKGFIPWDADIDLSISEDSYIKLSEISKKEFPSDMWLHNTNSDPNFVFKYVAKIRDINSDYVESQHKDHLGLHNGLQIDINIFFKDAAHDYNYCSINNNEIYPLRLVPFENITIKIPKSSEIVLKRNYHDISVPSVTERIHHQGKVAFQAANWVKKKYPQLYTIYSQDNTNNKINE